MVHSWIMLNDTLCSMQRKLPCREILRGFSAHSSTEQLRTCSTWKECAERETPYVCIETPTIYFHEKTMVYDKKLTVICNWNCNNWGFWLIWHKCQWAYTIMICPLCVVGVVFGIVVIVIVIGVVCVQLSQVQHWS